MLPALCSAGPQPGPVSLCGRTDTSPRRKPVCHRDSTETRFRLCSSCVLIFVVVILFHCCDDDIVLLMLNCSVVLNVVVMLYWCLVVSLMSLSLKDEVINVSQGCSDTFQQQVQRLHSYCLLSATVST